MNTLKEIELSLQEKGVIHGHYDVIKLEAGGGTSPLGTILSLQFRDGRATNIDGFLVNAANWVLVDETSRESRRAADASAGITWTVDVSATHFEEIGWNSDSNEGDPDEDEDEDELDDEPEEEEEEVSNG